MAQEEVVLAWETLQSKKEGQTVGKQQKCHQNEKTLYAVCVIAFLLQNRQNHHHHHRALEIPLLGIPFRGFPDMPLEAPGLEEEMAPFLS